MPSSVSRKASTVPFFLFICTSTCLRSYEAGIVSSLMPVIRDDLQLTYTEEGTIAAATDYGIAPGALMSIVVFSYFGKQSQRILSTVMFGIALATFVCCWIPNKTTLVLARVLGGFLWSAAASHFPVWINRIPDDDDDVESSKKQKTIWFACTNVSLLGGTLLGYIVGSLARSFSITATNISWIQLYFLGGVLMALCGLLVLGFDDNIARIDYDEGQQQRRHSASPSYVLEMLKTLLSSGPFVLAVAITGCITGGVVFALYFITQVCEARGMNARQVFAVVTAVFVSAPAPGMLFGSWLIGSMGGYTDHVITFRVALQSALVTLLATLFFPLTWWIHGHEATQHSFCFVGACYVFFFAGAMAGPPLNGVAVSAVPRASHVASGLQFCLANTAKIFVPQLGGLVCHQIGLVEGFNATLVVTAIVFVALCWIGYVQARQRQRGYGYQTLT